MVKHLNREANQAEEKVLRRETLEGSHKVVALAMTSNALMFTGKLYAAIVSGSIARSLREPDSRHPYGFSKERTAYALVSGVGIFFLGGGVSMYHGLSHLLNPTPHEIGDPTVAHWVLLTSFVFEMCTMAVAFRQIRKTARASGMSFVEYLRHGSDPTAVQVFLEDCSAVIGIMIASVSLTLSKYLALPILDSLGSIGIGVLLGSVAVFLVRRNIASLVETSMPLERQKEIEKILEADPVISSLHDVKTTQVSPDWVRFKAEVLFKGDEVTRRYIRQNPEIIKHEISTLKELKTDAEIEEWMIKQGGNAIGFLGQEVDRIEVTLKAQKPEVKHCDLEM
ncbi:hypothetical protein HDV05_008223 [Chytridiales sp. JEL 0842]|nr:hypothetical protein HDV05_008223 [Chytridiales sp. JEL 0842]